MSLRRVALATLVIAACGGSPIPALPPLSLPPLPSAIAGIEQRPRADAAELTLRIDALVAEFAGEATVWIADAGDRRPLYARGAGEAVLAASLWKLGALVHIESLVERRALRYEDTLTVEAEDVGADGSLVVPGGQVTVDEALELMIAHSDNGTALAFLRIHGGEAMNASLRRARIDGIRVQRDRDDENVVTAHGVGVLMQRLAERRLVSAAASDRMLARLERQEVTGRSDAHLPPGTRVAHKTGDLAGLSHDAAVVWTRLGPRVVVVLTRDADGGKAHELIARIAKAAFDTAQ